MLPIPHLLLFVPAMVLAALFVTALAVNAIAGFTARSPRKAPQPAAARPVAAQSAQIIYFRPRKTSLPSPLSIGVRHRA